MNPHILIAINVFRRYSWFGDRGDKNSWGFDSYHKTDSEEIDLTSNLYKEQPNVQQDANLNMILLNLQSPPSFTNMTCRSIGMTP
jgi:hypothetical protein